jgi:hypothetical protein
MMVEGAQTKAPKRDEEKKMLYETALMEVVEVIPLAVPRNTRIKLPDVRDLMVLCWLRGAEWAAENPELAKHAIEEDKIRRRR